MHLSSYYLDSVGQLRTDLSETEIKQFFNSKTGLLWVDIGEASESDSHFLENNFSFHPLTIEDSLSNRIHTPKVDELEDYLFIIFHGINYSDEAKVINTAELALFLGRHFVVSVHNFPLYSIDAVKQQTEMNGYPMKRGADFLAHALIDTLVDNVQPTIDTMSSLADVIEDEAIYTPRKSTLEAIMRLKRSSQRIHRVMAPQREMTNRLSRGEFPLINRNALIFYRDIYDHLLRIEELNQAIKDRVDNALSTYLSSVANTQNETMRVLSIVATIFMPLTLLAGIYGMNFEYMPELQWRWGYFFVLGIMAAAIIGLVWWFWARKWIAPGQKGISHAMSLIAKRERLKGYEDTITRKRT